MAVRTDEIQLKINFITDESKQLAKTLLDTKKYNNEIEGANKRIEKYKKELDKANLSEEKRSKLLKKIAADEQKVADNMEKIVAAGKDVEKLDLGKVTPAQLTERAKQLEQAIRRIPQSHPEFEPLQQQLRAVNGQLTQIRATSKGISADKPDAGNGGGLLGGIVGKVSVAIAGVQAFFATVQGLYEFAAQAVTDYNTGAAADSALEDRLRSTEAVVGRTLQQLQAIAEEQAALTLFDDDQVKKGEELLLTFTNIREEIFDRTIPAALDLSTVFQQDVSASAVQLGKALNDPINGVTALSRIGITFSEEQKKTIATMVEMNDVAGAQAIILGEVERQVGGAAQAAAQAGTGPMQQLAKRFGEVKESVGGLIANGLQRLQPVGDTLIVILEKLVGVFTTNKTATGEYSVVVNILAGVLKAIGIVLQGLMRFWQWNIDVIQRAGGAVGDLIGWFQKLPMVGQLLETFLLEPLRFLRDALFNLPATWAGFVAGVKQSGEILRLQFLSLVLGARAFAKEIELALTFDADARRKIEAQLSDIRAQQAAAKAGKTVGEAYAEARDAVLAQQEKEANTKPNATKKPPLSVGGLSEEEADKRAKDAENLREKKLRAELAGIEANEKRKALIQEGLRIKGEITEQAYETSLSEIAENGLRERLALYKRFNKAEEVEALALQNTLLEIEAKKAARTLAPLPQRSTLTPVSPNQDDTTRRIGNAAAQRDAGITALDNQLEQTELAALRGRFEQALISEQEYNVKRLELERQFLQQKLNILNSAAVPQTEAIRQTEQEKFQVEQELGRARIENERRLIQMRQQLEDERRGVVTDAMQFGIQLLGQDEAARKRNASVIKAFEIGQVVIQGIAEIQKIFALWAGIPGGQAIATQQAIRAGIRSAIAVAKIATTKFYRGGDTGPGYGAPDETGHRIAGVVHANEYVVPAWLAKSQEAAPILGWLENKRLRGYAEGGLVAPDTTPTVATYRAVATASVPGLDMFAGAVAQFERIVAAFPREVKSRVNYLDIEEAASDLNTVRGEAQV